MRKVIILTFSLLVLTGCGKGKGEDIDMSDWTQGEIDYYNRQLAIEKGEIDPEETNKSDKEDKEESKYIGYDKMKVKREQYDKEKYGSAAEHQYKEIDMPYLITTLGQIENIDKEMLEVFNDNKVARDFRYDEQYDPRGWVQDKLQGYKRLKEGLSNYREPHYDMEPEMVDKYKVVVSKIDEELDIRVRILQDMISNLTEKTSGEIASRAIHQNINDYLYYVENLSGTAAESKVLLDAISDEFTLYKEAQDKVLDEANAPRTSNNYD